MNIYAKGRHRGLACIYIGCGALATMRQREQLAALLKNQVSNQVNVTTYHSAHDRTTLFETYRTFRTIRCKSYPPLVWTSDSNPSKTETNLLRRLAQSASPTHHHHTPAASNTTPDERAFFTSTIISGIPSSSRRTRLRNSPRAERISVAPNPPPEPTTPAHPPLPLRPRPPVACRRNITPSKPPSAIPDVDLAPSDPITRFRLAPPAPLWTFRPLVPPPMPSAIFALRRSGGCFRFGLSLEADARRSTGIQFSLRQRLAK